MQEVRQQTQCSSVTVEGLHILFYHLYICLTKLFAVSFHVHEGSFNTETVQYRPYYLTLNVLLLPKDQTIMFYYMRQQIIEDLYKTKLQLNKLSQSRN